MGTYIMWEFLVTNDFSKGFPWFIKSTSGKFGGLACWFGILGLPFSNNPFHKGIQGIQTTGPQTTNGPLADTSKFMNYTAQNQVFKRGETLHK